MAEAEPPELDFRADKDIAKAFQLIGEFIFWFSQVEFTIRFRLKKVLQLPEAISDPVTASYDFSVLCTVATKVLSNKYPTKEKAFTDLFNRCLTLNTDRVRIAHGLWTVNNTGPIARHVARGTLKASLHFTDPGALEKLTDTAKQLMSEIIEV